MFRAELSGSLLIGNTALFTEFKGASAAVANRLFRGKCATDRAIT